MSKYLISTIETYRVDSEEEAKKLIEETRKDTIGVLSKYTSQHKEHKTKGEVDEEWYKVTLTQMFNEEREPASTVEVNYKKEGDY